jgi:hypothetical protein
MTFWTSMEMSLQVCGVTIVSISKRPCFPGLRCSVFIGVVTWSAPYTHCTRSSPCTQMRYNKRMESARTARPTRKDGAPLLAAHSRRYTS